MLNMNWADLPEELLHLILSNLFAAKDRYTFSLVCRSWNAVTLDQPYHCSPALIWSQRSNHSWKLFQHNGFYSTKFPQVINAAHVRCARHGWLLMSDNNENLYFFDPFNEEKIHHLPKYLYIYEAVCFSNKPTSKESDCIVVGIMVHVITGVVIEMLNITRGDDKWTSYKCSSELFPLSVCSPILHRGYFYCLDWQGNLYMNELGNQSSWCVVNTNSTLPPDASFHQFEQQFLIKLEDEHVLMVVLVACDERKVSVYKMDIKELPPKPKDWKLVDDLSNKVLFVSINGSFAMTNPSPPLQWMTNKIFFPKFSGDNGVYYSMDTKKYHSYDSGYCSDTSHNLRDREWAAWVLPEPTPRFPTQYPRVSY